MPTDDHRSTARVISILKLLSSSNDGYTLTEIAQLLDVPKSSLFPIVHTLADHKFLYLDQVTAKYYIGLNAYVVGITYLKKHGVFERIIEEMHRIVDKCSEVCQLGVLEDGLVLYLSKVDSPEPIRLVSEAGKALPAYCTSLGKSLLSNLSFTQLEQLYPEPLIPYTKKTITSLDTLYQQLLETRNTSIAYEIGEMHPDISCMSTPLWKDEKIIAAISVSVPSFRFSIEKQDQIRRLLLDARQSLEHLLEQNDLLY